VTVDLTADAPMHETARELARVDAIRLQIIGSFCHDIRQPLTAALLRASALADELQQPSQRAALRDLQMSLREIATTSETVFDAVRLSRAEVSVQNSLVYLPRLCARLASVFQVQAKAKGLRIRFASHRVVAQTDEALLLRLLQNLVSNAIKFTATGSILATCRMVGGALRCEVRDSGIGIGAEKLAELAAPAPGLRARSTDVVESSGIGLWNAREFAKLLGARLRISSEPGGGTRVRLDVPCPIQRQQRTREIMPIDGGEQPSALVLCDDEADCRSIERAFVGSGWTCALFSDPLRFLATINTPGLQPTAVVIPARVGNITAEFLLRILSSRFEALIVLVHLHADDDPVIADIEQFAARLVFGEFTAESVPVFN
jgi:two-component sensor histidine kinase